MIKLPYRPDGQWTITQNSDKLPDIVATRNLTLDREGYIRLSKPTASFYSEVDDGDFGVPVQFAQESEVGAYFVLTEEAQFSLDMYNSGNYGTVTVAQLSSTDSPINTSTTAYPGVTMFNQTINYANPTDKKIYTVSSSLFANAWTIRDVSALLEDSALNVCLFTSGNSIAVTNDNQVDQLNTSYAAINQLQIPNDYTISGIAYNNNFVGITTHAKDDFSRCMFYVWDGSTSAANYATEVPSVSSYSPIGYGGTFAFLSGNGVLYQWYSDGIRPLAALPSYYSSATYAVGRYDASYNASIKADGDLIHVNLKSTLASPDFNGAYYNHQAPGGIWTYDPAVGFYHRHAPSGTKIVVDVVATTDVNTTTDQITVTTAYPTGTPVRYYKGGGTAITELTTNKLYYTIYVDSTHIQLASSYENAIASTEINLTGTGNNAQSLHFYQKADFGQSYLNGKQGVVWLEGQKPIASELSYQDMFYGAECALKTTTEYDVGGFTLKDSENRGYFVTTRLMSGQLQEQWNKIFIKHSELITDLDKIIVKYRTTKDTPLTYIKGSSDGLITWSDTDTFTTTDTQWANVVAGDEVEIIQGAGSGYLVHISSISEAGGTYTVNLEESIKNISASDTGRAIASRWTKITELNNGIITNEDGYSEIALDVKSKAIQFKVELRGEDVEIEEILIAHQLHKPVA